MTTRSRIAAFLSVSALCLGVAAAPAASAAETNSATTAKHAKAHSKHKAKAAKTHTNTQSKTATPAK